MTKPHVEVVLRLVELDKRVPPVKERQEKWAGFLDGLCRDGVAGMAVEEMEIRQVPGTTRGKK